MAGPRIVIWSRSRSHYHSYWSEVDYQYWLLGLRTTGPCEGKPIFTWSPLLNKSVDQICLPPPSPNSPSIIFFSSWTVVLSLASVNIVVFFRRIIRKTSWKIDGQGKHILVNGEISWTPPTLCDICRLRMTRGGVTFRSRLLTITANVAIPYSSAECNTSGHVGCRSFQRPKYHGKAEIVKNF